MARILQLTDLHLVAKNALASRVLDTQAILAEAIDRLTDLLPALGPPDVVLITGDISDDGSAESYEIARTELAKLGLPILVIPGNHDSREAMRAAFADLAGMPTTGLIDWRVQIGDTCIIGLDTLVEGSGGGRLRSESLAFLGDALESAGARPVVIALHHPPLKTGIRFMDAIGLENAAALKKALSNAAVEVTILAGHVHGVHHGMLGRHRVATSASICSAFPLDLRADAPIGFTKGPTGCAVIDTASGGIWSAISLDIADGLYAF
jgi:3',5'-cyclic AMP phosphodiesterase CpdA